MKTLEKETKMPVQVSISESVTRGRPSSALKKAAEEGILLHDYLLGKISIGELKETLGMQYMDDAHDWLHQRGVAVIRKFRDPKLEAAEKANFEKVRKEFFPEKSK